MERVCLRLGVQSGTYSGNIILGYPSRSNNGHGSIRPYLTLSLEKLTFKLRISPGEPSVPAAHTVCSRK